MNSQYEFHNPDNLTPEQVGEEPSLTYHQWRGDDRGRVVAPTSNDAWESLLRTNAELGRDVSELRQKVSNLTLQLEDANRLKQSALEGVKMWSARSNQNADDLGKREEVIALLTSQLGGVVTACHLEGYNVGEPIGEWLTKQFADAKANLAELLKARAALRVIRGALP